MHHIQFVLVFKIAVVKDKFSSLKFAVVYVRDGSSECIVVLFTNAFGPIANSAMAHKEESHYKMNCLICQAIVQVISIPKAYLLICLMHLST